MSEWGRIRDENFKWYSLFQKKQSTSRVDNTLSNNAHWFIVSRLKSQHQLNIHQRIINLKTRNSEIDTWHCEWKFGGKGGEKEISTMLRSGRTSLVCSEWCKIAVCPPSIYYRRWVLTCPHGCIWILECNLIKTHIIEKPPTAYHKEKGRKGEREEEREGEREKKNGWRNGLTKP